MKTENVGPLFHGCILKKIIKMHIYVHCSVTYNIEKLEPKWSRRGLRESGHIHVRCWGYSQLWVAKADWEGPLRHRQWKRMVRVKKKTRGKHPDVHKVTGLQVIFVFFLVLLNFLQLFCKSMYDFCNQILKVY